MRNDISRREALARFKNILLSSVILTVPFGVEFCGRSAIAVPESFLGHLKKVYKNSGAAAHAGEVCMNEVALEDPDRIAAHLYQALGEKSFQDAETLIIDLQKLIALDFKNDHIVIVENWVLSRTESLLLAYQYSIFPA